MSVWPGNLRYGTVQQSSRLSLLRGKKMAYRWSINDDTLYGLRAIGVPAINKRLKNVFESGEFDKDTTISKMETVY